MSEQQKSHQAASGVPQKRGVRLSVGFSGGRLMLLGSYRSAKGRAKLDDLWRDVIRLRSKTCEMCDSARATDCAHFVPRGILATRWHPDNGNMLCAGCHKEYDKWPAHRRDNWKIKRDGWYAKQHMLDLKRNGLALGHFVDTDTVHAELVRRLEKA